MPPPLTFLMTAGPAAGGRATQVIQSAKKVGLKPPHLELPELGLDVPCLGPQLMPGPFEPCPQLRRLAPRLLQLRLALGSLMPQPCRLVDNRLVLFGIDSGLEPRQRLLPPGSRCQLAPSLDCRYLASAPLLDYVPTSAELLLQFLDPLGPGSQLALDLLAKQCGRSVGREGGDTPSAVCMCTTVDVPFCCVHPASRRSAGTDKNSSVHRRDMGSAAHPTGHRLLHDPSMYLRDLRDTVA